MQSLPQDSGRAVIHWVRNGGYRRRSGCSMPQQGLPYGLDGHHARMAEVFAREVGLTEAQIDDWSIRIHGRSYEGRKPFTGGAEGTVPFLWRLTIKNWDSPPPSTNDS